MASYLQKMIFIALTIAIGVPHSTSHRRRSDDSNTEQYLRDLCSETDRPDVCWNNILKPELRRLDDRDDRDIADGVIKLAKAKSKAIREQLEQWRRDSNDERLKEKYRLCFENYSDVSRDLEEASRNLGSDGYRKISDQIEDAEDELEECRRQFGSGSFDPGHVADRNNELALYLDVVRAAAGRLEDYYDDKN